MAVIISIIVGLVAIVNWAVQHTEEYYYQYDWDWDNASWQDTVPQQDTISFLTAVLHFPNKNSAGENLALFLYSSKFTR